MAKNLKAKKTIEATGSAEPDVSPATPDEEPPPPPPAPVWVKYLGKTGEMRIADRTPEHGAVFQVHACQRDSLLAMGREGPEESHTPVFEDAEQPEGVEACCLSCSHGGTCPAKKEEI